MIRHVAALGSSFAAGPGIPPVADRAAGRSGANYAALIADDLGARLTDLSVSGARIANVLRAPQRSRLHTFPPQLDRLPVDADLVTVTVGGNDLGYIPTLLRHSLEQRYRLGRGRLLRRLWPDAAPSPTDADVERVALGLAAIVETVRFRAAAPRIVLVDYLTLVGPSGSGLPDPAVVAGRALADAVNSAFARAAARTGADLVRASSLSLEHGIGSAEPWVTGFRLSRSEVPFHPTAAGMRAAADEVLRLVSPGGRAAGAG